VKINLSFIRRLRITTDIDMHLEKGFENIPKECPLI
jgi:hypothetical protein